MKIHLMHLNRLWLSMVFHSEHRITYFVSQVVKGLGKVTILVPFLQVH